MVGRWRSFTDWLPARPCCVIHSIRFSIISIISVVRCRFINLIFSLAIAKYVRDCHE